MAERRMFSQKIIDSDAFLDMPLSSQALYFHLSMRADDDGFINNPKKIQRMIGCEDDDLKLLIVKNFIIPFESGIVVIKHWKIHNYIQRDRYKETVYREEKALLDTKDNKAYTMREQDVPRLEAACIQPVAPVDTPCIQVVPEEDEEEPRKKARKLSPPTVEEVKSYCEERENGIDAENFVDYYTARNWMLGKVKMKDWKAAVRTWERMDKGRNAGKKVNNGMPIGADMTDLDGVF